jgi:hypothetical protein
VVGCGIIVDKDLDDLLSDLELEALKNGSIEGVSEVDTTP